MSHRTIYTLAFLAGGLYAFIEAGGVMPLLKFLGYMCWWSLEAAPDAAVWCLKRGLALCYWLGTITLWVLSCILTVLWCLWQLLLYFSLGIHHVYPWEDWWVSSPWEYFMLVWAASRQISQWRRPEPGSWMADWVYLFCEFVGGWALFIWGWTAYTLTTLVGAFVLFLIVEWIRYFLGFGPLAAAEEAERVRVMEARKAQWAEEARVRAERKARAQQAAAEEAARKKKEEEEKEERGGKK